MPDNDIVNKYNILDIFTDKKYIIPIYQRKYAWTDREIEQLLEDIDDYINESNSNYYLGTMIVDKKNGYYEVIDGQQRLTTLYLLILYLTNSKLLTNKIADNLIKFEAREKYKNWLDTIKNNEYTNNVSELSVGYNTVKNYFEFTLKEKKKNTDIAEISKQYINKLEKTYMLVVHVPKNINLNHFFEIMNTRGKQLELYHIAKARFMSVLEDNKDRKTFSIIWDACSHIDSYLDNDFNSILNNSSLQENAGKIQEYAGKIFDELTKLVNPNQQEEFSCDLVSLGDILAESQSVTNNNDNDNQIQKRFESIINFPYFLLYVNAAGNYEDTDLYNEQKLLIHLEKHWKNSNKCKEFMIKLIIYRLIFDKYIIKREFQDTDDSLHFVINKNNILDENIDESISTNEKDGKDYNRLVVLESMLRITYTSPRNMQWITELLNYVYNEYKNKNSVEQQDIIAFLEKFCIKKIKENYQLGDEWQEDYIDKFNKVQGFNVPRIIFTYLDYLIYRDGYEDNDENSSIKIEQHDKDYTVHYRNSIEHFYPQHPEHTAISDEDLNKFGNLALITVSSNSKFSNLLPNAKREQYKHLIKESLKLCIMASYKDWNSEAVKDHQQKMVNILYKDIYKDSYKIN